MSSVGMKIKLLAIDDDEAVLIFLNKIIKENFSYDFISANDGLDGLVKVKEELPDIILLDISMPVLSGIDFLEGIRADKRFFKLPVIVLTANKDHDTVHSLLKYDVLAYIVKPLTYSYTLEKFQKVFPRVKDLIRYNRSFRERNYKAKLLLVDENPSIYEKVQKIFGSDIEIVYKNSGTECLTAYLEQQPEIVCLGDNLGLITKEMIVKKIREYDRFKLSKIFLCTGEINENLDSLKIYDDIIEKNSPPEKFRNLILKE